jgi:hypothetical protein
MREKYRLIKRRNIHIFSENRWRYFRNLVPPPFIPNVVWCFLLWQLVAVRRGDRRD